MSDVISMDQVSFLSKIDAEMSIVHGLSAGVRHIFSPFGLVDSQFYQLKKVVYTTKSK